MPSSASALAIVLWLALVAVGVRVSASAFRAGRRSRRRLLQGAAFLLTALTLAAFWQVLHGELPGQRDVLVVYSPELAGSTRSQEALEWLRSLLEEKRSVAFLRLERGGSPSPPAESAPLRFLPGRQALEGGWPQIAQHAGRLEILGEEARERGQWLQLLGQKARELLGEGETSWIPWRQPTVLVLYDHGETWSQLLVPEGRIDPVGGSLQPAWVREQELLLRSRLQLFVLDVPRELRPDRLRIDLPRDTLPAGVGLPDLPDKLCIRLPMVPRKEAGSWSASLRGAFDDRRFGPWTKRDPKPLADGGAPCLEAHPSELRDQRTSRAGLAPGFHRLAVEVRLSKSGEAPRLYQGVRYLRAVQRRVLILYPPGGGPGLLGRSGWDRPPVQPVPLDAPLRDLLPDLLHRSIETNRPRLRGLGRFDSMGSPAGISFQPLPAAGSAPSLLGLLQKELEEADALVLVEPSWAQLTTLAASLRLETAVSQGTNLLIIGPPARDPASTGLDWLPSAVPAEPAGTSGSPAPTEPLLADRKPRLYLLPDHSRLTYLPASAEDPTTLQDVQAAILAALRDRWRIAALDRETSADIRKRALRVFPPLLLDADLGALDSTYARNRATGARLDTAPSSVSARLRAVLGELKDPYFPRQGIRPRHFHPATQILLFTLDLPAGRGADAEDRLRLRGPGPGVRQIPPGREILPRDLARLGVRILHVELRVPSSYEAFYRRELAAGTAPGSARDGCVSVPSDPPGVLPKDLQETPPPTLRCRLGVDTPPDQIAEIARELAREIEESAPPAPGFGRLERRRAGRIIDERSLAERAAPELHAVLPSPLQDDALAEPYAVLRDDRDEGRRTHRPLPGIVARRLGEGEVIAAAWSPLSRAVWEDDAGHADRRGSSQAADGWGLQRLLDLVDLTGAVRPLPGFPIVREIRELADQRTLQIDVWTRLFGSDRWRLPEIDGTPLQVVATNPASHRVTLQYRPGEPVRGDRELSLAPGAPFGPEARPRVFLDLRGGAGGERTVREMLGALAAGTGGAVFDPARDPGLASAAGRFVHPMPGSWLFGAGLCLLLIGLLGPLVRPWTAVTLSLRRWRDRRRRPESLVPPEAILDVDGVLAEWGYQPGLPSASRRAGTPAAEKPWESGEDLSGARRSTLVPFTSLGRVMGLPMRRPSLRQRHVTHAMEAVILVDNSRSLTVPAGSLPLSKSDLAPRLAALLARVVWAQAGTVRAAVTRPASGPEEWGPSTSDDDGSALESFVRRHLGALGAGDGPWRLPDLETGHVLFLLSDLLALEEEALEDLLRRCGRDGIELRVAHLFDPNERELVGLVWNAEAGVYHDRTEWEPAELALAYAERTDRFRNLVLRAEGRFLTLSTDSLAEAIREDLRSQGFLS